ncbi:plastocyanin/azurin family copper-binding protein [Pontibacter cellulosilyticus]|uniref:Azurin n=1 Tax=Pontibacter cellulosilyticus TaxID=1720253 RepID=A0A923SHI4_9BACT|nr:plastocyanin/azurin family copper-binding protein [Pontibacter cellulosilyticus]MBC5991582.1 azurin [Pontibacter cellulosilyticus]
MKIKRHIHYLLVASVVAACGTDTDKVALEAPIEITDTTAAVITADQDTTLQQVTEITLKAIGNTVDEMVYDQDTLDVRVNTMVKLTLINEGTEPPMIHNVVFTHPDKYKLVALAGAEAGAPGNYVPESEDVIAASPLALPGQTVELEFTAPSEPGAYNFVCTYPNHWRRMNGVLMVK